MTRFCLVRHGQTDWNLLGRYQGQSDVPLNQTGRAQAVVLSRQLQDQSIAAVYSSDLERARETAEILASVLLLPVIIEPRLREINLGEWEGQLVSAIQTRYADLWQQRTLDPAGVRYPGGETVGQVAKRVYTALDDISRVHPIANVLIASHGLALATVICKAQAIPIGKAYQVIPENAEPVWVSWNATA
jgi:broad specificity phosphatase PhoE